MTIMAKNAPEYGLVGLTPETPLEYDTMDVTAATHLNLVADLTDSPVSELMALNPALLKGIAPAGYSLRVPKGSAGALRASLEMIPPDKRLSWRMHKVADGETLASISKRYGASAGVIAAANKLLSSDPVAGDRLAIPAHLHGAGNAGPRGDAALRQSVVRCLEMPLIAALRRLPTAPR